MSTGRAQLNAVRVGFTIAPTTVTYNAGRTSPEMNVVDDPGNAANLVVTSGTQNDHVGLRSNYARRRR
jgi:hypothetical protein